MYVKYINMHKYVYILFSSTYVINIYIDTHIIYNILFSGKP